MAESDMKPLSELDLYNNLMDENSLLPMTVRPSGSNITRKVYYNALKTQIAGYDLVGTLTAGSTSVTLSSVGSSYNPDADTHTVGERVTNTEGEDVKNYICFANCEKANWETNGRYFVEYTPINSNSTIGIYTSDGTEWNDFSISNNAITITFDEQSSDIGVKVRVT